MIKKKTVFAFLQYAFFILYAATVVAGAALCRTENRAPGFEEELGRVLPSFQNHPAEEAFEVDGLRIFPAREEKEILLEGGAPVTANVLKGFALWYPENRDGEGPNPLLVGIDLEGKITAVHTRYSRTALVPENRISSRVLENTRQFFSGHRPEIMQKASEGAVS